VRGFTRGLDGKKFFIDHDINSIQNFIAKPTLDRYHKIDVNVYESNIFHTKMMLKEIILENYLFTSAIDSISDEDQAQMIELVNHEMTEIFNGRNIYTKEDEA
jgi:S-adenosylmethionine decarboxylase